MKLEKKVAKILVHILYADDCKKLFCLSRETMEAIHVKNSYFDSFVLLHFN